MVEANPAIARVKARARLLHQRARAREPDALARLRRHPALAEPDDVDAIQRKHCLDVIARELGFRGWQHASRVLSERPEERDLGTLLYPSACSGFTNHWFASHAPARAHLLARGGYLLGYKTHAFIVTPRYIEALGLDPDDPDWDAIARDWLRPEAPGGRARLYAKLIARRPRER